MDATTTSPAVVSTPAAAAPAVKPKAHNKCHQDGCSERIVKIVGDCRYCNSKFCSKHRLPEAHTCAGLQTCREEAMGKLERKVLGEKCVSAKV